MSSHYVDLRVVPDVETSAAVVFGALYDRLHRAMVQQKTDRIGVSFPSYSVVPCQLGDQLRLHGSEQDLAAFMQHDWLLGVRDHVRSSDIRLVPEGVEHRCVRRRQFKSNIERLRRRRMKRKGETAEQAARALPDSAAEKPNLPYVHLHSLSTGQPFCLFVALGPLQPEPTPGPFNTYGLGRDATVPWF